MCSRNKDKNGFTHKNRKRRKDRKAMDVLIPVSIGEVLDRVSILEMKEEKLKNRISDFEKTSLQEEINNLWSVAEEYIGLQLFIYTKYVQLRKVNKTLWDLEEKVRWHEKNNDFSEGFIEAARLIYTTNDLRSRIKREINSSFYSDIVEIKSY